MEFNSETWNMSPENIFLGDIAFGLTKTDARLPSYARFRKMRAKFALGKERVNARHATSLPTLMPYNNGAPAKLPTFVRGHHVVYPV